MMAMHAKELAREQEDQEAEYLVAVFGFTCSQVFLKATIFSFFPQDTLLPSECTVLVGNCRGLKEVKED